MTAYYELSGKRVKSNFMKGIILAGGKGTRLQPATFAMNKHMVPILNKPMIEYPISTLLNFGCCDILVVSGGNHIGAFAEYLGDGSRYRTAEDMEVKFTYKVQRDAGGIAQALMLAKDFCRGEDMLVILGDNVFDNDQFKDGGVILQRHAMVYVKDVADPNRFGVAKFKKEGEAMTNIIEEIVEKPQEFVSPWAVTGLYHYPAEVFDVIKTLKPSARGELEITDVNNYYAREGMLEARFLQGFWSDAGTPESLYQVTEWAYGKLGLS